MTDTSLTRSTACNLIMLATLPTEEFLATAFSLEDRPIPYADPDRRASTIQLDLTVVSLLRGYIRDADPRCAMIATDARERLLALALDRLVGPPGSVLSLLRTEYLIDPACDLTPEWEKARQMQATNTLPADVPPLGRILTKSQTSIGSGDAAVMAPAAMKAILLAQACLRAMLPPEERKPHLYMRSTPSDPHPLRAAQEIGNRILVSKLPHSPAERDEVARLTAAAEGLLETSGFAKLAEHLSEFRQHFTGKPRLSPRERRHGPTVSDLLSLTPMRPHDSDARSDV